MSSIEIVSHCYNSDEVPIYSSLAQLQFSSLLLNPPSIDTTISVCYTSEDQLTVEVINWFRYEIRNIKTLHLKDFCLPKEKLFRRAIGRNIVAKSSSADVIWFVDCDYLFRFTCTLSLAHYYCLKSDCNMVYPEAVNINITHGLGDGYIERASKYLPYIIQIDPDHFTSKKQRKAIGGIQVVRGDYCREHGYLDGTRWMNPVNTNKGFRSCKCDVPFRKQVGKSEAVDIPGVYRVRHSFCGRDGGTKDHGKSTRS